MLIGLPKEIKDHEHRVGLTPMSVSELTRAGHQVIVETNCGKVGGFDDQNYSNAGATVLDNVADIYSQAEMIIKVKEPQPAEYTLIQENQILFTYLHLAPDPEQTEALLQSNCIAIAYETVTDAYGGLPLLAPMSEVAGRMSIQAGAHYLENAQGGSGILLGGVPGVMPGKVVIIGGGTVGSNAARMAVGLGAQVTILDRSARRLKELDQEFQGRVHTLYSLNESIEKSVIDADLVIGAVLIAGATTPRLLTRDILLKMRPGSVLIDVAIDQGGCFETSRPTTHSDPVYKVDDITHYCVTNMGGGVARTSTIALNTVTLPFIQAIAQKGYRRALLEDSHLRNGLNIFKGKITHEAVSKALHKDFVDPVTVLQDMPVFNM